MNYDRQEYIGREGSGSVNSYPLSKHPYLPEVVEQRVGFTLDVRERMVRWFKSGGHLKDTYALDKKFFIPASESI